VEERYGKGIAETGNFRQLVRRKDVDVVFNGTPDHRHVLPYLLALRSGKDVICEKPLTLTVGEGRVLADVARQIGRITQVASENRSIDTYLRLVELVINGRVGALRHIHVSLPSGRGSKVTQEGRFKSGPAPERLDYETWLGQAPWVPYCEARVHWNFRWNLATSGGMLTDWGAHLIDLAQLGHGTELGGPVEVEGKGEWPARDAVWNTAAGFDLRYRYADGVTMSVVSNGPTVRFEGTEGWVECGSWRAPLTASRPSILDPLPADARQVYRPSEIVQGTDSGKGGEHRNFIDGVKSRKPCDPPFEVGHRTISIAHIGNIAMLLGRPLKWNPEAERFVGDAEADAFLSRPQREPWTLADVDRWLREG
jgi:predicted dehydrogenase